MLPPQIRNLRRLPLALAAIAALSSASVAQAQRTPGEVLLVCNENSPVSTAIANDYADKRHITNRIAIKCADSALKRDNVKIETDSLALNIVFEGKRAVGIRYRRYGHVFEARARNSVILSGGAVNSALLLQLSGIGPGAFAYPSQRAIRPMANMLRCRTIIAITQADIAMSVCPLSPTGTPRNDMETKGRLAFGRKKEMYCENPIHPEAIERGALIRTCQA